MMPNRKGVGGKLLFRQIPGFFDSIGPIITVIVDKLVTSFFSRYEIHFVNALSYCCNLDFL